MNSLLATSLHRFLKPEHQTRAARSVEYFGWIDLFLGCLILIVPIFVAELFRLPPLSIQDGTCLRVVGALVATLGVLYLISGRFNAEGFVVASLLDRPLVPLIMALLWWRGTLPGVLAIAFSVSDFGGFLWTLLAWREDVLHGENIGGPEIGQQTPAEHSIELFGWLTILIGFIALTVPSLIRSLLQMPSSSLAGPNYLQLIALLVGGLGMLYFVSGSLCAEGIVFASLFARLFTCAALTLAWWSFHISARLTLALLAINFGGMLWTFLANHADIHRSVNKSRFPFIMRWTAWFFAFVSGVLRNARTFHPDGRVFRGTVRSLNPSDPALAAAADRLVGCALLRIGMGVMKRGMPRWLADHIPDAPSIASRFFAPSASDEPPLLCRPGEDFDLLASAGGDRLYKLLWNLATGGAKYGLDQFDYFHNIYSADVPYRLGRDELSVWIRLVPRVDSMHESPTDGAGREQGLTDACARHGVIQIEMQRVNFPSESFVPIAEIILDEELYIDQETLHYSPFAGRKFEPIGFITGLRRSAYPASFQSRAQSQSERARREHNFLQRLAHYLAEIPTGPKEGGPAMIHQNSADGLYRRRRRWMSLGLIAGLTFVIVAGIYLFERFTRDRPVDYADDVMFFERGSTGGEKMDGIPYWVWVTLPEIFPEYLPDKKAGRGYSSFGMIYEPGDDPRYALPLGMSRRDVSGLDVVYLNCAVCHTGTLRDTPASQPRWIPGMPAHEFNLGAWGTFLTTIPKDQKFTPQRILDQIDAMQDDPHRVVPKPDLIDRLIFRFYAVYLMREKLLVLGQRLSFIDNRTWGPGRVDTFNAPKALLNFPMGKADPKELMGNVDFPSVWNQGPREGMQLHWDGNNTSVNERNLSAAFGTGAFPPILDTDRVLRMAKFLRTAQPPAYPYAIDKVLAAKGKLIYEQYCLRCHGTAQPPFHSRPPNDRECDEPAQNAQCVGTVVPIEKIGTDRSRLDSYTWLLAVNQSTLYAGYEKDWGFDPPYPQRFHSFRKTAGYASMPLDGIWLRAPYLHNGSVPNLRELLEPKSARSPLFYRGNDVFDPENVGFISNVATQNGQEFYSFDTTKRGNGNQGHEGEAYGTELSSDKKQQLLEYLKTF
jgi:hypothetical protein